jgi:adenine C2-methylase RlmN of 23S rRNA A2503 and tRNA A37
MNCQFCYTTKIGLKRILSTADIVEQLVIAARMWSQELGLGVVTNVMFMDMGEPFQNIHNMITAHFGLFYIEKFILMDSDGKYYCCASQQIEENI